jgi:NADH-quinone oxidoreductase E subunit
MFKVQPRQDEIAAILERHPQRPGELLAILLDIQETFRYLPKAVLKEVARYLGVPESRVYSVATFYKAFTLKPRGERIIRICLGTACHLRGSPAVLERLEEILGIKPGETTPDGRFTLETVNCLGACALAPVVVIGEETYGQMTPEKVEKLLREV